MATYRYVLKDITKSFKQNFDDADIRENQILYWIMTIANSLRVQQQAITGSGLYESTFSKVTVSKDVKGRPYIDLPGPIMDLPNEGGISYITYNEETGCCCAGPQFAQVWFQPTTVTALQRLYGDEYECPKPSNPYFYRVGHKVDGAQVNRVYLIGIECIEVSDVEIGIKCTLDPKDVCNLDDTIPIPDELISELTRQVLSLGRFVMMIPEEIENDGEDEAANSGVSVSEPPSLRQNEQQ